MHFLLAVTQNTVEEWKGGQRTQGGDKMCLCIVTSCPPIKSFVFSFLAVHLYRLYYLCLK